MKKTIFLSMAMAFVTITTFAQEKTAGAPQKARISADDRAKRQTDRINAAAQLSSDQYAKVLKINKDFIEKREAIRASGATQEDMKAKFKELGKQEEAQLKTVLTPAQVEKVEAAKKQQRESHGPKGE